MRLNPRCRCRRRDHADCFSSSARESRRLRPWGRDSGVREETLLSQASLQYGNTSREQPPNTNEQAHVAPSRITVFFTSRISPTDSRIILLRLFLTLRHFPQNANISPENCSPRLRPRRSTVATIFGADLTSTHSPGWRPRTSVGVVLFSPLSPSPRIAYRAFLNAEPTVNRIISLALQVPARTSLKKARILPDRVNAMVEPVN